MSLNILLLFYIDPSFNYSKSFLYWLLFLVLMSYMFYVNHITNFLNSESCKYKYLRLALFPSHILASKCFLLHLRESHFITTVTVWPNLVPCFSSSVSFTVLYAYNLMVGAKYQTAATCWGTLWWSKTVPFTIFPHWGVEGATRVWQRQTEELTAFLLWDKRLTRFRVNHFCPLGHLHYLCRC